MAYIGAEPVPGQNREVDDISSGFNGNATAFTLQVNSVNVSPESANNILVNLGGVLQNPGTDYTVAASTLTFTTAPAAGLSFFGLILGAGINTATVADDTIGASKLIDTAVTAGSYTTADITVDAQGRITAAANGTIAEAEIANNAVTTAKIADSTGASDGVTTAKIATSAITTAKIADSTGSSDGVTTAKIATSAITTAKIADSTGSSDGVTSAKIATSAITTAKIADQAVDLTKLPHGTSSNDGKFLRANNGADPTFETVSGTTINNNANNRVITGSGTANTLEGEANFTYDGDKLVVKSGTHDGGLEVLAANNNQTTRIKIQSKHSGGSERNWFIEVPRGSDILNFFDDSHGSHTQLIDNGDLSIVDGNLLVASGHGIDFSATSQAGGSTSELFDDYEEGTFTPSLTAGYSFANTITYTNQSGHYAKIGNQVFAYIYLRPSGNSAHSGVVQTDGNSVTVSGLPYTSSSTSMFEGGGYITYMNGFFGTSHTANLDAMPWVPINGAYVIFHTPEDGNNVIGSETIPTNNYLIFHVRYTTS